MAAEAAEVVAPPGLVDKAAVAADPPVVAVPVAAAVVAAAGVAVAVVAAAVPVAAARVAAARAVAAQAVAAAHCVAHPVSAAAKSCLQVRQESRRCSRLLFLDGPEFHLQ